MRGSEIVIFDDKTLGGLLSDIYSISRQNRTEIRELIIEMSKLLVSPHDVINIAPIIQQYLEVGVKNDEQLIKIATIVQRIVTADAYQNTTGDPSELLTEIEKEQLIRNTAPLVKELKDAAAELEDEISHLPKSTK